ncbi:hypothetical protein [Mucilaginibacter antarcticus]|uniref:Uncharacterized protein n=1 Tax=Mucilaginibacter antarcticus TaxID=1855725 RepID=A0ABW5XRI1_9SPHI
METIESSVSMPSTKMDDLDFFIGTFKGSGNTESTMMSARRPINRTVTGHIDLGGFWYE